jgi:DNA-binding response OmpR family regulator
VGRKVLIVEDEPSIVESLGFILQRAGIEIETATDGTDALRRIRRGIYAGVILDIMLPGMNGFEVLRAVRADISLAGLPVIVLTAKGQANDRRAAEAIGATAFITKPFSNDEIVRRVTELTQAG